MTVKKLKSLYGRIVTSRHIIWAAGVVSYGISTSFAIVGFIMIM